MSLEPSPLLGEGFFIMEPIAVQLPIEAGVPRTQPDLAAMVYWQVFFSFYEIMKRSVDRGEEPHYFDEGTGWGSSTREKSLGVGTAKSTRYILP